MEGGQMPFAGKVVLVTGASRRSGRATALKFAQQGADVIVHAHRAQDEIDVLAAEIAALGRRSLAVLADISDETAVTTMFARIAADFGGVDVLVNNAGIRHERAFTEMTLEEWRSSLSIIVDGTFLCSREAIRQMLTRGGGRIVNIGGLSAHIGARQRAHVSTGKAAVVGLTHALAAEYGASGITVNCVVPGRIGGQRSATAGRAPDLPDGAGPLVGRLGTFEDVAHMIVSVCHPSAGYVTGQSIHVSGGLYLT